MPSDNNDIPFPQPIPSDTLFKGDKEVLIVHRGVIYRLRITANDRLILTK